MESSESVRRLMSSIAARRGGRVSDSTRDTFLWGIRRFCDFAGKDPDELIRERLRDMRSDDVFVRRRHEELVARFAQHLRDKGYTSNTVATAVGAVRSLYRTNYLPLVEVSVPSGRPEREYKVPTREELAAAVKATRNPRLRAFVVVAKDCGMGLQDLLRLGPRDGSPTFGSIRRQIDEGRVPVHVRMTREKTGVAYDTFLGDDAVRALRDWVGLSGDRFFAVTRQAIQIGMARLGRRLGWKQFSPHCLRKFFRTQLSLAGVNEAVVEYMMGHSLGRIRGAYLVPPAQELARIYAEHYDALRLPLTQRGPVAQPG